MNISTVFRCDKFTFFFLLNVASLPMMAETFLINCSNCSKHSTKIISFNDLTFSKVVWKNLVLCLLILYLFGHSDYSIQQALPIDLFYDNY